MFRFDKTIIRGQSHKYTLYQQEQQLRYSDFLAYVQQDEAFRAFFIDVLADVPFAAYQWETPAVRRSTVKQSFEFVVTRSPGIDLPPNPGPFRQYFDSNSDVAVFDNLGGDAKLIAPAPAAQQENYSHIGVFTERAPSDLQHALWRTVGRVTEEQLSERPLWLNTAGGGVAWLHVRLDSRPKYYRHRPYAAGR